MVLGAMGSDVPVCFYCNKPGHLKKDCYKLRNDLSGNRGAGGSRGGRAGRYGGGRGAGGRQLNAISEGSANVEEVMRLGLAAFNNKSKQQANSNGATGRSVSFAD